MDFRINDLKNFIETSSCSTLTQTATKLEISQPALSESLKRLETDLNMCLFFRSRTGIQLTSSGKALLAKAQRAFSALNNLKFKNDGGPIFDGRSVSIGCHVTVASYSIPKTLAQIKKLAPDYKVELKHDLSRNIQQAVQKGSIDIGIVVNPAIVPDLVISRLAIDIVSVWSSARNKGTDTLICDMDLFQTQSIIKKWKNRPEKIISSSSLHLIAQLVSENIGHGILPEKAIEQSGFKLEKVPSTPSFRDEICVVYRPEFGKEPFEKLVIDSLKNQFL